MKEYPLLGRTYTISDGREIYVDTLRKSLDMAEKYRNIYIEDYKKKFQSIDAAIDGMVELGLNLILQAIDEMCIPELISMGFYSYDARKFAQDYFLDNYDVFEDACQKIYDRYADIVLTDEQKKQYREERKANRGRWVGGGFGVGGAVKGAVKAGAMNMVTGAAHSAVNAVGNAITNAQTNSRKRKLFEDPEVLNTLSQGLFGSVDNLAYALMDFMDENTSSKPERVTKDNREEASIILKNIQKYDPPEESKKDMIFKALYLNPYKHAIYSYIIDTFGDPDNEAADLATVFGLDLMFYKAEKIQKAFSSIDFNDRDSLEEACEKIPSIAASMGIDSEYYLEKIDTEIVRLDRETNIKKIMEEQMAAPAFDFEEVSSAKDIIASFKADNTNPMNADAEVIEKLLSLVDGCNGYAEWALFDIFSGTVEMFSGAAANGKLDPVIALKSISSLKKEFEVKIREAVNNEQDSAILYRTTALNVLLAAADTAAIEGIRAITALDAEKINESLRGGFKKETENYRQQKEENDTTRLEQCALQINEGETNKIALACELQAELYISQGIESEKTEELLKIAAGKANPEAMLKEASFLLDRKDDKGIAGACACLLEAAKIGVIPKDLINKNNVIKLCEDYDDSQKSLDGLVMFVGGAQRVPGQGIMIMGYIMCDEFKRGMNVSVYSADKTFKADAEVIGMGIGKEGKYKEVLKKDDLAVLILKDDESLGVETDDLIFARPE